MEFLIQFCNISTILLCVICKIPQITTLLKKKNAEGLSPISIFIELSGYTIVMTYNFEQKYPLSAFLEYIFLVLQDIILYILILYYKRSLSIQKIGLLFSFLALFYGFSLFPHLNVLPLLVKFATPISASSKIIQLKEIWNSKQANSVSLTTWAISTYTCLTRIITTLALTGDLNLLANYFTSLVLNSGVISSAYYFQQLKKTKIN